MTAFISIDTYPGPVWLNVDHIVSIEPSGSACEINLSTGATWRAFETADEVVEKLRRAALAMADNA